MPIPVMFLQELTRQRLVEELQDIEKAVEDASRSRSSDDWFDARRRIIELRLTVERLGITEAV